MRYYKYYDGIQGDRSETFSFISFFPDSARHKRLTRIYIKPVSTAVYTTLVKFKVLPPLPARELDLEAQEQLVTQEVIVQAPEIFEPNKLDSERRKQLALQAVQDRLKQKQNK